MSSQNNRPTLLYRASQAIIGIGKHLAGAASVTLDGVAYKPTDLTTQLQSFVTSATAIESAKAAWMKLVSDGTTTKTQSIVLLRALKAYLLVTYGAGAIDLLGDFGFAPPKTPSVSVQTRAVAADKNVATRAARHTMGKNQKKNIKGTVPAAAPATPPSPAATTAPATPAPVATTPRTS